jgi:hypothetical protein
MNIVYVIGNGFDLNLGLKTSYQDFYDYLKKQPSDEKLIADMKENLDSETWADLEFALGKYTANFSSTEEFQKLYYEISDKLAEYIRLEEKKLELSEERKQKICKDMIAPESYFRPANARFITEYSSQWQNVVPWNINIITFNYSRSIERLLDFKVGQKILLGKNRCDKSINLSQIIHIHGVADTNETILLGVNDSSQIVNESFRTDIDFLDLIVKPQTNRELGEGIDANCSRLLQQAHMICIFGSSLGDTDKIWWEFIGTQLKRNDCRVIYFVREKDIIPGNRKQLIPQKIRECQNHILSKTNPTSQQKEEVKDKIWIGHNTDMFKLNEIKIAQ